jgi:hypothetical protein
VFSDITFKPGEFPEWIPEDLYNILVVLVDVCMKNTRGPIVGNLKAKN